MRQNAYLDLETDSPRLSSAPAVAELTNAQALAAKLNRAFRHAVGTRQTRVRLPRELLQRLPTKPRERNQIIILLLEAGLAGLDAKELLTLRAEIRGQMNLIRQALIASHGTKTDLKALENVIALWRRLVP
jgi:ABC-type cobalamin transport system ATPase subunit